jgi:hypothetical protein
MTARLTAFYHVDPWRLLAEIPMGALRALSKMLPRLRAEQSFEVVDQLAVGINAAFSEGYTKGPIRRWVDAIQPDRATPRQPAPPNPEKLRQHGIQFVRVPKVIHAG